MGKVCRAVGTCHTQGGLPAKHGVGSVPSPLVGSCPAPRGCCEVVQARAGAGGWGSFLPAVLRAACGWQPMAVVGDGDPPASWGQWPCPSPGPNSSRALFHRVTCLLWAPVVPSAILFNGV